MCDVFRSRGKLKTTETHGGSWRGPVGMLIEARNLEELM